VGGLGWFWGGLGAVVACIKHRAPSKKLQKKKLNKMPSKVPTLSTWLLKCIQPKSKNY